MQFKQAWVYPYMHHSRYQRHGEAKEDVHQLPDIFLSPLGVLGVLVHWWILDMCVLKIC